MNESPALQSLLDDADRAAAAGDFQAAERLLRQIASLQEAELGATHPSLANTLNNLGVVCERTGHPAEAEHWYRRAYAIAAAALPPDHPDVETSRRNLEQYCAVRNLPVDLPAIAPGAPGTQAPGNLSGEVPASVEGHRGATPGEAGLDPPPEEPSEDPEGWRGLWLAVLAVGAVVVLWSLIWMLRPTGLQAPESAPAASPPPAASSTGRTAGPATEPSATAGRAAGDSTSSASTVAARPPGPTRETPSRPPPPTPAPFPTARARPPASDTGGLDIVDASLCRQLATRGPGAWRCVPLRDPVERGIVYFYTRVRTPDDATIEHRWYRNGRLERARTFRISTNMDAGYRTFSQVTIGRRSQGSWRVELRSRDGRVLASDQFVVR